MKTWAIVRFRFDGTHYWADAPDGAEAHLKNEHRHEFHATVEVEQEHDDRDVEYLLLKARLSDQFRGGAMGRRSCEMMAGSILRWLRAQYGESRGYRVTVEEDGENGARLEAIP